MLLYRPFSLLTLCFGTRIEMAVYNSKARF